jgi:protein tyrosine/serine phosphatase
LEVNGVPNLHRVADGLYRSAQPTAAGMRNLETLGIKSVVNLRAFHSDRYRIARTGLTETHIAMKTWHPEREDAVRFLKAVGDPSRGPILVHCQHGADRTGAMLAIYRIAVQGWSKEDAAREMTDGGYGFHEVWVNLVPWLNGLDFAALRAEAGLPALAESGSP